MSVDLAIQFGYDQDDAEDIAQDAMLKLWCVHSDINDEDHLKALTTLTTQRMCIDKWRKNMDVSKLDEAMPAIDEDSKHDHLEYAELEQWMNEQIDKLPSTSGIILRMRQLEHRELSEIADILGIQQTSVSTLLSRARIELIKKIKRRDQQ